MAKFEIYNFQKHYKMLNCKLEKEEPALFELGKIVAYYSELKNGFAVKNFLETTSNGTKVNYVRLESAEECEKYEEKLENIIKELQVAQEEILHALCRSSDYINQVYDDFRSDLILK